MAVAMERKCTKPIFLSAVPRASQRPPSLRNVVPPRTARLTSNDLDLVDWTKPRKVVAKSLLRDGLVEVAQVDVASRAGLLDGHEDRRRNGRGLAPPDFEVLLVETDLAHERVRVEGRRRRRVEERDEGAALFGEDLDRVDGTEADLTEELVDRSVRREIPDVHGSRLWEGRKVELAALPPVPRRNGEIERTP